MTPGSQHGPRIDTAAVLECLPFGVLLLDETGAIVHANPAAHRVVAALAGGGVRHCHDLFACQGPDGLCSGGCALVRGERPVGEVRIDTVGGVAPGALWVTAAALPAGGTVLVLRPGWRGDRRRRTQERSPSRPGLRIYALGRTRVEAEHDPLETAWLTQRPGQLLKYLVCERARVVFADEIAEALWPHSGPRALGNARYSMHRLRTKLEPRREAHEPSSYIAAREGGYALDRERVWIDADEFERAVDDGRVASARGDTVAAAAHMERAMELYQGEFLADEPYTHWVVDERNRLEGLALGALELLLEDARERGDGPAVLRHVQRLAALEPLDSAVHRELIRALLAQGHRSDAKRRYDMFARRLREIGERPGFDLGSVVGPARENQR